MYMRIAILILLSSQWAFGIVLKPQSEQGYELSLIIVPGAQISPAAYKPLALAIQRSSQDKLWIKIAEPSFDMANPLNINWTISSSLKDLKKAGAQSQKIFLAGHSLGGAMIQHLNQEDFSIDGFIYLGSFINRTNRDLMSSVPSLTLAAELDGLTRLSRIAESFYHEIQSKPAKVKLQQPIAVIPGMNHMQFASGKPPLLVRKRDLKAEIGDEEAHRKAAQVIADFLEYRINPSVDHSQKLQRHVDQAEQILKVFIKAMELEGSYKLRPACSLVDEGECNFGSPWTSEMFKHFSRLPEGEIDNVDEFRHVWRVLPFHHPKINSVCQAEQNNCVLKTKTISQAVYEKLDDLDTGFASVSASEIRAKFVSRQSLLEARGYGRVDFESSDKGHFCRDLNERALTWALQNASKNALDRYQSSGVPMIIGDDLGPYSNGPRWIWTALSMEDAKDENGQTVRLVRAPTMKTPTDFPIKSIRGFHYCKLLSPARALEWIYIDSLRR